MNNISDYSNFKETLSEVRISVNEKKDKEVTKKMWDRDWALKGTKQGIEDNANKRENALLTVFQDPNDAEKWIDSKYDDLPPQASHMTVYESVNEAMAYKKAQKFTKKLNDDALLKDLIYVANKIHDKMGTNDDVQEWLKTVITYGNNHPQQWHESLDEAAPKMTVDPDAEYVSSVISRLGVIGRNAKPGSNVHKDITKALKALQNLRSSIQVGR